MGDLLTALVEESLKNREQFKQRLKEATARITQARVRFEELEAAAISVKEGRPGARVKLKAILELMAKEKADKAKKVAGEKALAQASGRASDGRFLGKGKG